MIPRVVRVDTRASRADAGAYSISIGPGAAARSLRGLPELATDARRALVVVDANLPEPFVVHALDALGDAGIDPAQHTVEPTERTKTIGTLHGVLVAAAEARLDRHDLLVALGGGIVGDIAGFAAATHKRGVGLVQCPTTLLAMVDASVGGKTGVNLEIDGRLRKNAVGAFHQPLAVAADTDALGSLPDRELSAGLGECLKHGMLGGGLGDPDLLGWTETNLDRARARDADVLAELIERGVSVKARAVEADERETARDGGRALLNLGHTYAHAIEGVPGCPFVHGEAVGLGLIAASAMSAELGLASGGLADRVRALCARAGLPTDASDVLRDHDGLIDSLLEAMLDDKKSRGGQLRVVAPLDDRTARVAEAPDQGAVVAGWRAIGAPRL